MGTGLLLLAPAGAVRAQSRILFVGNSFTHGFVAPVLNYNTAAIIDENFGLPPSSPRYESDGSGPWGGVPGIFKKLTDQAGLNYEVHIEAINGVGLAYHYTNALSVIQRAGWNQVVLQELSTGPLPTSKGGQPVDFFDYSTRLEQAVHSVNATAKVYLFETWARADLTYPANQPYSGQPITAMGTDLHNAYYQAYAQNGRFEVVAPVGDAWQLAIQTGVAMANPYSPTAGQLDLWSNFFHASKWGSYLGACVLFYQITGVDPRTLGAGEIAAADLGIAPADAVALQQVAYNQVNIGASTSTYSLTATAVGSGTVSKNPDQRSYLSGANVSLTATPAAGFQFSGWSGDATGTANPLTVAMTANKAITATFTPASPTSYTLNTATSGSGTVARSPDQATYPNGASVSLTATPAAGFTFTGWSGDATGTTNPLSVSMTANKTITATFSTSTAPPQVTGFTLVNADNEQDIQVLTSGATLNLATLPTRNLNVRANTNPATVGSVAFALSGPQPQTQTDAVAPYALLPDVAGNYPAWTPPVGSYSLTATPYTGSGGSGQTFYRAVNVNGGAIVLDGQSWAASASTTNFQLTGRAFANQNVALSPATDATRASMIRSSVFGTSITATFSSVPAATYNVYLYVWEDNSPETYDVTVQGQVVLRNYNSGAAGHWDRLGPYAATVSNGSLSIGTAGGYANLSGIELWQQGTTTGVAGTSLTVNFSVTDQAPPAQYSLTVTTAGNGTVSKSPDQLTYSSGSTVTLTATPAAGQQFTGWSGAATGNTNPLSVSMTANKTITATFAAIPVAYTLTTAVVGSGTVTPSPNQATYFSGAIVSLTAAPAAGFAFSGWSGDATGTTNPLSVSMTANKNITATFTALPQFTLGISLVGSGTVTPSPNQATYSSGATVSLTATPAAGFAFSGWSGDATGTTNPLSVTMNANKAITATFAALPQYTLGVTVIGSGTVTPSPNQITYVSGSTVTLTATPAVGFGFSGWSGSATGTANPLSVAMTANKTITATFTASSGSGLTFYRALNINGNALVLDGQNWEASSGVANFTVTGTRFANQNVALNPATDAPRASMIRSSVYGLIIDATLRNVPTGTYAVYAYVWEDNNPEVFSVRVQGKVVLSNFNSGSAGRWSRLGPYTTSVTSTGTLVVSTTGGYANLSGIEVWRQNPAAAARTVGASGFGSAAQLALPVKADVAGSSIPAEARLTAAEGTTVPQIFPNPSHDGRFWMLLPTDFQGEVSYSLVSAMGARLAHGQLAGTTQPLPLDFSHEMLASGLYYLLLEGQTQSAQLKLVRP
ncbi:beta strand repeat-containing protein [Hymenobacter antarcticus]|uniref:Bacterial repeat domain-containing protein n=1 Tax=Hymenobacter antarcticus TaxID=486270 RepID=A0ABP7PRZ9_9BACT